MKQDAEERGYPKGDLDPMGPIAVAQIKQAIEALGPIRLAKPGFPFELFLDVKPCMCGSDDCDQDVAIIERRCGLSQLSWTLNAEELEQFESLDALLTWVMHFGLDNSFAERVMIEQMVRNDLGMEYYEIEDMLCVCADCSARAGPEFIWNQVVLRNLSFNLQERDEWLQWADDQGGPAEDSSSSGDGEGVRLRAIMSDLFELGYATARLFGEHRLRNRHEQHALAGLKLERDTQRRAQAAGRSSARNRQRRLESLLIEMERLLARNPDLKRLAPLAVAELAMADAVEANETLWRQGKGRLAEYVDELRADHRYHDRFAEMFTRKSV